jgi:membrane dipeptidase
MVDQTSPVLIDALQFCRWSRKTFEQMREAGMSAVHATVAYHESFRKTVEHLADWHWRFRDNSDLIMPGREAADIDRARTSNRTAIFFGLQSPMPVEDDLGLLAMLHHLGIRFLQITYNNQSLLGAGWMEPNDSGLTRMGHDVIREMNQLGMVIDLSHAGERTTLQAIEASERPVAITHANPAWWQATGRNVSKTVCRELAEANGMLGLSLYPHHLPDSSATTLERFCRMAADVAEIVGVGRLGIGSDLCQDQPDDVVRWMREGRWKRPDPAPIAFPDQTSWFRDNRDFPGVRHGLVAAGFSEAEAAQVLGGNWYHFMVEAFTPLETSNMGKAHNDPHDRVDSSNASRRLVDTRTGRLAPRGARG